MAIPPEPIAELLPLAGAVVLARVVKILVQDPQAPLPEAEEGATDVDGELARQQVLLQLDEVLRGELQAGDRLEVVKPAGDYTLQPGMHGPFLLDTTEQPPVVLGRYGPDTYPEGLLRRRLAGQP